MPMSKKFKKSFIFLFIAIVLILIVNIVVSKIIEKKVTDIITKENSKFYTAKVESVKFKLLRRSIAINGVLLSPTNQSLINLRKQKSSKKALESVNISSIKIDGIHLLKILFKNDIIINQLHFKDVSIKKFKNDKIKELKKTKENNFNLDSIYLKSLNGVEIDKIKVTNLVYHVTDIPTDKIVFKNNSLNFVIPGIKLENIGNQYFKLKLLNNKFVIHQVKIEFPEKKYAFSIDAASINIKKGNVNIKKLSYIPTVDKVALAKTYKYNDEVFTLNVEEIDLYNFNFSKIIKNEGIFIDSISISAFNLDVYKDKRQPFNLNKRPELLHNKLKQMKLPLLISKIKMDNSNIFLENRLDKDNATMKVSFNDARAQITNITSIKSYRENPLIIDFYSNLMDKAPMYANMTFPLGDHQENFYFKGRLAASKLSYYDEALFPILGLKIINGDLDSLTFNASANNTTANGEMTMLYHNLDASVFKSDSSDENKFLSWGINTVLIKSNPGKKNKIREAVLYVERTVYKGAGNYIWKTLQSGIVNTLVPGGKTVEKANAKKERKENKIEKKENKKELKEERKEERKERHNKKK